MGKPGKQRRWRRRGSWLLRWGGLAVCVVVAGVWGVSEWWYITLRLNSSPADESRKERTLSAQVRGVCGGLHLSATDNPWFDAYLINTERPVPESRRHFSWRWKAEWYNRPVDRLIDDEPARRCWWFAFDGYDAGSMWSRDIILPLWFPLLLAAAPTALAWRSELRRRRRERVGKCSKCGYDLAGLVQGSACPECGEQRPAGE